MAAVQAGVQSLDVAKILGPLDARGGGAVRAPRTRGGRSAVAAPGATLGGRLECRR